ncbi:hypothetical protein BTHI11S_00645 [Bosea thiooxidans]
MQACQTAGKGRLAAAGFADHGQRLARLGEVDAAQCENRPSAAEGRSNPVFLDEIARFEDCAAAVALLVHAATNSG